MSGDLFLEALELANDIRHGRLKAALGGGFDHWEAVFDEASMTVIASRLPAFRLNADEIAVVIRRAYPDLHSHAERALSPSAEVTFDEVLEVADQIRCWRLHQALERGEGPTRLADMLDRFEANLAAFGLDAKACRVLVSIAYGDLVEGDVSLSPLSDRLAQGVADPRDQA